jgi:hypothetical protein
MVRGKSIIVFIGSDYWAIALLACTINGVFYVLQRLFGWLLLHCLIYQSIMYSFSAVTTYIGMAVLNACEQITERLRPVYATMRENGIAEPAWSQVTRYAYFNRINLSAQGFYAVPTARCG